MTRRTNSPRQMQLTPDAVIAGCTGVSVRQISSKAQNIWVTREMRQGAWRVDIGPSFRDSNWNGHEAKISREPRKCCSKGWTAKA